MRVTVLGLGNMGRAFAGRALERGHQVTVWNRSAGKAEDLVAAGATEAESVPKAVTDADVTLVVLSDDEAVLDVCLGIDGALASVGKGAVLANVSTVSPETARELADSGPSGRVLDTPVMGAPALIAKGGGKFLVGGPAEAVAVLAPLIADIGDGYVHCGPTGTGVTAKLVSNLQLVIGVAALAEAVATARAHGLGDDLLRTVFADSAVVSPASRLRMDTLLDPEHPGWFTPELARKDVRLALRLAEQAGVPVQLGPAAEKLLTTVIEADGHWPDFSAIIEAVSP
jgi:3-hydroxyisobutyrate dehydrogenase-like beta-hydroxyacid dehydrogenase